MLIRTHPCNKINKAQLLNTNDRKSGILPSGKSVAMTDVLIFVVTSVQYCVLVQGSDSRGSHHSLDVSF